MPSEAVSLPTPFCSICHEIFSVVNHEVRTSCLQCKSFYCVQHTSKVDPDYCDNCLRIAAVQTTSGTLTDDEGVTHTGRSIQLTGEFWMEMQRDVLSMSDKELEDHVLHLQQAVREIEVIRDYRRIALAHGENEVEARKSSKLRRLRLIKDVRTGKLTVASATQSRSRPKNAVQSAVEKLKALGLSQEQIIAALKASKGA